MRNFFISVGVLVGMLCAGAENAIPTGWALCDGNNSTPDLRNRFVFWGEIGRASCRERV